MATKQAFIPRQEYTSLFNRFKKALNAGTAKRARFVSYSDLQDGDFEIRMNNKIQRAKEKAHEKISNNQKINDEQRERLFTFFDYTVNDVMKIIYDENNNQLKSFHGFDAFIEESYDFFVK